MSSFYTDPYIIKLTRDQMYFYQYLLLCQRNNLSGIYECPVEVMSFESKFSIKDVREFLGKFEKDKKLMFVDDYVILFNFLKNQSYNRNIMIAILNSFLDLPDNILKLVFNVGSITKCFKIKDKEMQSLYDQIMIKLNPKGIIQESFGNDKGMIKESLGNAGLDENNDKYFSNNGKESLGKDNALNQIKSNQTKQNQTSSNKIRFAEDCDSVADDDDDDLKDNLKTDDDDDSGIGESKAVLLDHGISGNTAKIILDKFVPEYVIFKIRQIDDMNKSGQIKNLKAYILKTFENTDQDTADNELCAFLSEERRKEEARKPKMNPELERMKKQQEQDEKFIQETEILVLNATEKDKQTFIETVIEPSNMYKQSFNRGGFENGFVSVLFRTFLQNKYKEAK